MPAGFETSRAGEYLAQDCRSEERLPRISSCQYGLPKGDFDDGYRSKIFRRFLGLLLAVRLPSFDTPFSCESLSILVSPAQFCSHSGETTHPGTSSGAGGSLTPEFLGIRLICWI